MKVAAGWRMQGLNFALIAVKKLVACLQPLGTSSKACVRMIWTPVKIMSPPRQSAQYDRPVETCSTTPRSWLMNDKSIPALLDPLEQRICAWFHQAATLHAALRLQARAAIPCAGLRTGADSGRAMRIRPARVVGRKHNRQALRDAAMDQRRFADDLVDPQPRIQAGARDSGKSSVSSTGLRAAARSKPVAIFAVSQHCRRGGAANR